MSRRIVLAVISAVLLAGLGADTASADPTYAVMNADGGVFWRSAPDWNTPVQNAGFGVYNGTTIAVHCYQSGTSVPGSADTMWVQATVVDGPGYGSGWVNEHFVDDGQPINQAPPGVPACDVAAPAAPAPAPTPASTPAPTPGPTRYVVSATWRSAPLGSTLSIRPTLWARALRMDAAGKVWNDALAMAGRRPYSTATYSSMYEQLRCHLALAVKTPYNLDTWRPKVPWLSELRHLCNPT